MTERVSTVIIEKETKIKNKVFKEEDILRLAQLFLDLMENEEDWIKFEIKCKNGIAITGDTLEVFTSDYFRRQGVKEINFRAHFRHGNRMVCAYLKDLSQEGWGINTFHVEGEDSQWFDRTCNVFERYFDSVERQGFFARLLEYPYCIASGCGLYILVLSVITFVLEKGYVVIKGENAPNNVIGYSLLSVPVFMLLCMICVPMIKWCYPSVEFRFETKNGDMRLRFRKAITWILSAIIIPILLGFLSK